MDGPGAGTGSSAGGGPAPAGAVVVPVEAAAAARPAAPPAAGPRRPAWTWVDARVTFAGAPPAAPAPRARAPAAPRAGPPAAWTRLSARLAWAAALFLLGCAAAGLAFFAMILPSADSLLLGKKLACTRTDAEVAKLRAGSEKLLLAAAAQVLAATMGLLVPARPVAVFGLVMGWVTGYRATNVLWWMLVVTSCNGGGTVHGALAFHFWLFFVVLGVALAVGAIVSTR